MNDIVVIEGVVLICYVLAAIMSYKMLRQSFHATSVWLHIFVFCVLFCLAAYSNIMEWMGIAPNVAEQVEELSKGVGAYALFTLTFTHYRERALHRNLEGKAYHSSDE